MTRFQCSFCWCFSVSSQDIEADFVACRKEDQQKMTSDDLHTLLTLARYVIEKHYFLCHRILDHVVEIF